MIMSSYANLAVEDICWTPPVMGWVSLNIDNTSKGNLSASCGGILCGNNGE